MHAELEGCVQPSQTLMSTPVCTTLVSNTSYATKNSLCSVTDAYADCDVLMARSMSCAGAHGLDAQQFVIASILPSSLSGVSPPSVAEPQ